MGEALRKSRDSLRDRHAGCRSLEALSLREEPTGAETWAKASVGWPGATKTVAEMSDANVECLDHLGDVLAQLEPELVDSGWQKEG